MFDVPMPAAALEAVQAVLLSAAWKSSILLLLAGVTARLLSRHSAAARHVVWTTAMAGALAVPILEFILPAWTLPSPMADFALPYTPLPESSADSLPAA